jgi:cytochrome c2
LERYTHNRELIHMTKQSNSVILAVLASLLGCCSCGFHKPQSRSKATEGDAWAGKELAARFGCPACHQIPGIATAVGRIGPSLYNVSSRQSLAGTLPNTPENMVFWIRHPQAVRKNSLMPNMGIGEQEARDISAFLYTLN